MWVLQIFLLCYPKYPSLVAEYLLYSLNLDLARIGDWCKHWGMLVNPMKIKALVNSRSRTLRPVFPNLVLDGTVVERVTE